MSISDGSWSSGISGRQRVLGRLARDNSVYFVDPPDVLNNRSGWMHARSWWLRVSKTEEGVRTINFPKWLGRSYNVRLETRLQIARYWLAKLNRSSRPLVDGKSILYAWHPTAWPYVKQNPAAFVCYHVYDNYFAFQGPEDGQSRAFDENLAERANVIICVSDRLAKIYRRWASKVSVVENGVDAALYADDSQEPDDLKNIPRPRAIFVARLNELFDYRLLDRIAEISTIPIVVVGPRRAMSADIAAQADRFLTRDRVVWLGERDAKNVPRLVQHADVCLIPYKTGDAADCGSPQKLFEYLASGKPVISSDIESVRRYRDQGVVTIARNPEEWCRLMLDEVASDTSPKRESRKALARANSWDSRVRCISHRLEAALAKNRRSGVESRHE